MKEDNTSNKVYTIIENERVVDNVDLVIYQLKNLINTHFTKSEWIYLAYLLLYGNDFKTKLLDNEIVLSSDTINNMTTKFRKLKLVSSFRDNANPKKRSYKLNDIIAKNILITNVEYRMKLSLND